MAAAAGPAGAAGTVIAVEADVLDRRRPAAPSSYSHGPAARRRRYSRAIGGTAVVIAALFALSRVADWFLLPAVISLLAIPLAALLAHDRYRNLGHAVVDDRLISQPAHWSGSAVRWPSPE